MFKKERQREILRLMNERGTAQVDVLARQLGVSAMTIRRDLAELDRQGLIERVRGGALPQGDPQLRLEPPVLERAKENEDVKHEIGRYTAGLIQEREKIFLGSGSTTRAVAEALLQHQPCARHQSDDDRGLSTQVGAVADRPLCGAHPSRLAG
jgi:DeoR/GlpR family transcriptional regulator of sugar metabolism